MTCFHPDNFAIHSLPFVLVLGISLFAFSACSSMRDITDDDGEDVMEGERMAVAQIESIDGGDVAGTIRFREMDDFVRISGTVKGLTLGKHGFHVHAGTSCQVRGGHYNPEDEPHGSPDEPERHVGDLGNLAADESGSAEYERVDRVVSLSGAQSIVGHALVVHRNGDDYLSQPSGNAGPEIACGIIELQENE